MTSGLPLDVVIGFHRYPMGCHSGAASRVSEPRRRVGSPEDIAGGQVACTEFGHHTARAKYLFLRDPAQKTAIGGDRRRARRFDLAYFRDRGCLLAAVYQLNEAPPIHQTTATASAGRTARRNLRRPRIQSFA